ncbi:hypothetical protein R4282_11040 [Rhodococcus oxybenzonivorans]|uniref:hypothetical protein n=1 Tax=Rhodococcus oxybenzonivorans TaxID=1990687 RepID=UPI00295426BA|nr:hypothetical protein [Rhodococcus oxybenzonivorans]MDV7353540.1 hypothetical protein [Rhodococcus oxybenzonivorans]
MNTRSLLSTTDQVADAWAGGGLGILEGLVADFVSGTDQSDNVPTAVARREEVADRVVTVLGARAWHALPEASHGRARRAARRAVAYSLAADVASAGGPTGARSDCWVLTVHALELLTVAAHFDAVTDRTRELLGPAPEGRLLAAWQMVNDGLAVVATTRHEWVGADPATVAAAGWVLVDRMSRLLIAAALIAQARSTVLPVPTVELLVNAARRYAWNHVRGPAPEAATATHVHRSADLVRAFATRGILP